MSRKKKIIISAAVLALAIGGGYAVTLQGGASAPGAAGPAAAPELPTPTLGAITGIRSDGALTLRAQNATTTSIVLIVPSTQIYQAGVAITALSLKPGQTVAVVYYPPSIGAANVAQSVTVVSTQ